MLLGDALHFKLDLASSAKAKEVADGLVLKWYMTIMHCFFPMQGELKPRA